MFFKQERPSKTNTISNGAKFDVGTLKVIALACLCIALSVILTGRLSYLIVEREAINKLKSQDLVYIVQSIAGKIDGRIARAKETSLILSKDPTIMEWIQGKEKDNVLGRRALHIISGIARDYDYSNSFIVSTLTNNYWAETGRLIDTMTVEDPDDAWFFDVIASKLPVSISIDYNNERQDTFVFVDALVGDIERPIAVTGVGLNLRDMAGEFAEYEFGEGSKLWLIDDSGDIHLAKDLVDRGKNIYSFIPADICEVIIQHAGEQTSTAGVLEYQDKNGELHDLIYQSLNSTDWQLVLQIPRSESIGFLDTIKINTLVASVLSFGLIVFIFYLIATRIADPFKRAVLLSRELEKKVQERTAKIMDSIDYAKRLQEAVIPGDEEMARAFKEHFIIWRPRDLVGGDLYWLKKKGDDYVLAIVDCTGHGVPGALMTMAVASILNDIVDGVCSDDPAVILQEINVRMKAALHQKVNAVSDDGADIGICHWRSGQYITFAGARIVLYVKTAVGVRVVKGDRHSLGYQKSDPDLVFNKVTLPVGEEDKFYMTTDGFLDQNGGSKNHSFGKKRFMALIDDYGHLPLAKQRQLFEDGLDDYKQTEEQRDDITVIGFQLRPSGTGDAVK
ncbi:SpoIIE family protein phosphatase [Desulfoscipio gibsoniae]|uniref:Serine phosphatase RsbU, regulator of sigma subunit n=1 Tax=Desulfoscipio gibsoniae DSM 7213 TaxID=767817 RepID=R4KL08_9FIRM|nr:SpoIIE family protein phosphatase [Desulfoscipio gibsoniae]AGL00321.1 serine phosphatase RsbU, regulator of sigma subunit [Desulfoscipio gibsoniae DSM 7213]